MATNKEPEFSHYEQSERKYTEAELQELFDQLRKGSLMFFSLPRQNGKTAMREQLSMKWNVPPKDMVEVVRRKNCIHYEAKQKNHPWKSSRKYCNRQVILCTEPNDFCSYGERKPDETN